MNDQMPKATPRTSSTNEPKAASRPIVPPTIRPAQIISAPSMYGMARPAKRMPPPARSSDDVVVGRWVGVSMVRASALGGRRTSEVGRAADAGNYGRVAWPDHVKRPGSLTSIGADGTHDRARRRPRRGALRAEAAA